MARATFVAKARKANKAAGIKKGDSYWWWKFRRGGKRISKTKPRRSQLTQSEFYGSMYDAEDVLAEEVGKFMRGECDATDLAAAIRDAVSVVEESRDRCDENKDNLESAFPNGCPTIELLEARSEQCDEIITALESAADDVEGDETEGDGWRERVAQHVESINWTYE